MELAIITHPGLGSVMDPIINVNKTKQPNSPNDDQYLSKIPIKLPVIVGKLPPVPTPLMGAIRIRMPGGPEVLEYKTVTTPKPQRNEVLIRVIAASINKYDTMLRKGSCSPAPGDDIYPGIDCAGIIENIGPEVTKWKVGDEVAALLSGGGYATKVVTHEDLCLPIPRNITASDAASFPEVACNIILSIFTYPGIANNTPRKEPLRVLITGGGSGVGTIAIQFAKAKGCKVYCTTSTTDKVVKCEELGAHMAINYNEENFVDKIWRDTMTQNEPGVDMVLDVVGASWTSQNLRILKREGILFIVGMRAGKFSDILIGPVYTKQCSIRPASLRGQSIEMKAEVVKKVKEYIWPLIEMKKIKPIIEHTFPLEKAVWAHRLMESNIHFGKILLIVDPEKVAADDAARPIENPSTCD